jgi:hypothetical protein
MEVELKVALTVIPDSLLESVTGGNEPWWKRSPWRGTAALGNGNSISWSPLSAQINLTANSASAVSNALQGASVATYRMPHLAAALGGAGALVGGMNSAGNGVTIKTVPGVSPLLPAIVLPRK